jgi:hypothetical protein
MISPFPAIDPSLAPRFFGPGRVVYVHEHHGGRVIGVATLVGALAIGLGLFLCVLAFVRRRHGRATVVVSEPYMPSPLDPQDSLEEELTDIVTTGVPFDAPPEPEELEPPTAPVGRQRRVRAWDVPPEPESGMYGIPVRAVQVDGGPIVQLQTTEE